MISAVSARMPPSPRLSARITSAMYLTQMITTSAQNASDATPSAFDRRRGQVLVLERLAERVQRAGADVAEHHAEGAEGERTTASRDTSAVRCLRLAVGRFHDRVLDRGGGVTAQQLGGIAGCRRLIRPGYGGLRRGSR